MSKLFRGGHKPVKHYRQKALAGTAIAFGAELPDTARRPGRRQAMIR